ncbi:MAG: efflux RND transporter periplasmic adaptor subunit [Pseudomonadota bacterium]|nr:efflux RND transporter periplasmic adaptor subunit [Pseudomonadota bacterium]
MSDLQVRRAGVTVEPVGAPTPPGASDPASEGGLALHGTVTVPNRAVSVVNSPLAGTLAAVAVDTGDVVRAGQRVATVYSPQLLEWQRDYLQSASQLELAHARTQREEALFRDGIISQSRLQEALVAERQATLQRDLHAQNLKLAGIGDDALGRLGGSSALDGTLAIHARAGGTVVEQLASAGQHLEAGAPVLKLTGGDMLWLELQASREQGASVRIGDAVHVDGCQGAGRIVAVNPQLSAANQAVLLRAAFARPGNCLRPNQYVEARVARAAAAGARVSLPAAALVQRNGTDFVFVRESGGFRPVAVTVLERSGARVLSGTAFKPGSEVAIRGVAWLKGAWLGLGPDEATTPEAGAR